VVGRKVYGGVTQYIPLRVNTAGVMPIIFAQAIMFIPQIVFSFFPDSEFMQTLNTDWFGYSSWSYSFIYALMIIFFTYFYTAIAFNPKDVADNMKKQGGFIPGIRPGNHTAEYVDNIFDKDYIAGIDFPGDHCNSSDRYDAVGSNTEFCFVLWRYEFINCCRRCARYPAAG